MKYFYHNNSSESWGHSHFHIKYSNQIIYSNVLITVSTNFNKTTIKQKPVGDMICGLLDFQMVTVICHKISTV